MAQIKIDLGRLNHVLERLRRLDGNAQEPLEIAGTVAYQLIAKKFRSQGPGWAPLAERTKLRRRNQDKASVRILEDTGRLRNSITSQSGPDAVYALTGRELLIGSNYIAAATHNFGNPNGFGKKINIPARPYIPTEEEMITPIERKLKQWLEEYLAD